MRNRFDGDVMTTRSHLGHHFQKVSPVCPDIETVRSGPKAKSEQELEMAVILLIPPNYWAPTIAVQPINKVVAAIDNRPPKSSGICNSVTDISHFESITGTSDLGGTGVTSEAKPAPVSTPGVSGAAKITTFGTRPIRDSARLLRLFGSPVIRTGVHRGRSLRTESADLHLDHG